MKAMVAFMPDHIVNALGWTIFHSIWQGLIIGLILLLIFRFRPYMSSHSRYLLGVFGLAAIFASSLITFLMANHPVAYQAGLATDSSLSVSNLASMAERSDNWSAAAPVMTGWRQRLVNTFDIISIVWIIGFFLYTGRLAGGILQVNGMRQRQVTRLPSAWEKRLQQLVSRTGMKRPITFLQSQKVSVPVVIGILRPAVLIPAMIISGLPADQLETIILHELAHIRRHDFLVNILQSMVEALFFYHPVVWIISENIRQEREKCCDDYTVRVCGRISLYARALARLGELQVNAAMPSVAITGNKKNIVHRVERLINNQKMKTNLIERLMVGLLLLSCVLIITLSTGATLRPARFEQMESQILLPSSEKQSLDTVPGPVVEPVPGPVVEPVPGPVVEPVRVRLVDPPLVTAEVVMPSLIVTPPSASLPLPAILPVPVMLPDTSDRCHHVNMDVKDNVVTRKFHDKKGKDKEMKFVIHQGKVRELYVDGKKIPEKEFSRYQDEIDQTMEDLQEMEKDLKHARIELEHLDLDKIREDIRIDLEHFKEVDMEKLHEDMQKLHEEQLAIHFDKEQLQKQIERAMKDIKIDKEKIHEEMLKAREEMMKAQEEMKRNIEEQQDGKYKLSEEAFNEAMEQMERNLAEARESLAMIDEEQIRKMMDDAVTSMQNIDHDKIQREIEEAMKQVEEIDFAEIERKMQAAMQNINKEKINLGEGKKNIDEMIEELEKLELDKK